MASLERLWLVYTQIDGVTLDRVAITSPRRDLQSGIRMPIYDYRCSACRRRASLFYQTFSAAESAVPVCPNCGSTAMSKLVSRVAVLKSEESRMDDLADPASFGDIDENDPRSVARWARRMGQELGEDMGDDFREMVDQMESGEMPDDLGDEDAGGGLDDFDN